MSYNIGIETSPVRPASSRSGSSRNHNSSGEKGSSAERPVQRYSAALEEPSVPHDGFWNLTTKGGLLSPRKDQELEQLKTAGCANADPLEPCHLPRACAQPVQVGEHDAASVTDTWCLGRAGTWTSGWRAARTGLVHAPLLASARGARRRRLLVRGRSTTTRCVCFSSSQRPPRPRPLPARSC